MTSTKKLGVFKGGHVQQKKIEYKPKKKRTEEDGGRRLQSDLELRVKKKKMQLKGETGVINGFRTERRGDKEECAKK